MPSSLPMISMASSFARYRGGTKRSEASATEQGGLKKWHTSRY
jgi:hypothetical protein